MSRGLGEILIKIGVIDQVQLAAGLARMEQWGGTLLSHLVQSRMVGEDVLVDALAERFRYDVAHPLPLLIESSVLGLLPGEFCHRFLVLPIGVGPDDTVLLAMCDPSDLATLDAVRAKVRRQVSVAVAGPKALSDAIQSHYFGGVDRAGTPDPFTAGADSFGTEGLLPPVGQVQPDPPSKEIELPPADAVAPEIETASAPPLGGGYLPADQVAPRQTTGSGFLSDESEVVDVGDIFADHAAMQSEPLTAARPDHAGQLAEAGAPADDVETDEPDLSALDLSRPPPRRRGSELPTGELPLQSGDMPQAIHATEGSLLVVAAEAVSEKAVERMEAQKSAVAKARALATQAAPKGSHDETVLFGSPVSQGDGLAPPTPQPSAGGEAASALADARSVSPHPPPSADSAAILAARCESLELRLGLLTDLLIEKGLISDEDL